MRDHRNLHDGEVLLCSMRPSGAMLTAGIVRSLCEALVAALIAWLLVTLLWSRPGSAVFVVPVIVYVIAAVVLILHRYRRWVRARFRVTTERILLEFPVSLLGWFHKTLKWNQYQESYAGHNGVFGLFFRSSSLCIRYGNADGELTVCFPSLRHTNDLKHYLDKVDSAVRKQQSDTLKPFVLKPTGQRD